MKSRINYQILFAFFAFAILLQPLSVLAEAQQALHRWWQLLDSPAQAEGAGSHTIFLPVIHTPPGPPDFEITSPAEGWTVSGMMYFAAQPRNAETMTSVTFTAASTPLGTDDTPADGFRVFFDASAFPAGSLTLTAVASGPSGQTSKTITVNVLPDPPSSGMIGSQGGVLDSEIGSLITIPPGALPDGTTVTIDELSQEEVTAQNGIEWEAMGVTFLGAQSVQSTSPFSLPYRVASADFGNRVQPGQAVVNYQLVPDADGDGVDEIVVVNTASVAPNNDVISDPIPQILLEETAVVSGRGDSAVQPLGGVGGPPGTTIQLFVTGFNPFSLSGNVAEWTCADGATFTVPGSVSPNPAVPQGQIFSTVIPLCTPGPALVLARNLSTGSSGVPFVVLVTAPPPIGGPPGTGTLDFLEDTGRIVENIPPAAPVPPGLPSDWRNVMQDDLDEAREDIEDRMTNPDPDNQQDLEHSDNLLPPSEEEFPPPDPEADCLTEEAKQAIERQMDHLLLVASEWWLRGEREVGNYYFHMAQYLFQLRQLPTCDEEEPEDEPACEPAPAAATGGPTGMGSAPPPGGNGCGNANGAGGSGSQFRSGTGQMVIKVFSAGLPTPFSGVADPGGYFFIPLIPAGEPFTAVAYDLANNETRIVEGIGPETGDFIVLYFDFFSEQEGVDTVYWDGAGDGTSWHDPFNWNPNLIPGPSQHVIIDVPGDVTVVYSSGNDAIISLHSEEAIVLSGGMLDIAGTSILSHTLSLNGGTLAGIGDVTVGGQFTWTYGTMSGTGSTIANGGITFSGNYSRYLDGRTLENEGTAVFQDGNLQTYNGAVIYNLAGATFDFQGDDTIYVSSGGATFNNLGTVTKSAGSGTMTIYPVFNNSGTVEVQSGSLSLNGNGTHSGDFQGVGTLQFGNGTHTLNGSISGLPVLVSGGSLVMNGNYNVSTTTLSGGTLTIAAGLTADSDTFTLNSGTLTGDGDMNVGGLLTWTYGTMSGTGSTIANGGITFSGNHARYLDGRTLENEGTAVFQDGNLQTYNGAVISNLAGATFDFQGDDVVYVSSGGATFNNLGTVTKSAGSGTMTIYPVFNNNGTVEVQSGSLSLNGNGTHSGDFQGVGTLQFGSATHTLTAASNVQVTNGLVSGGAVTINGNYDVSVTTLSGGTLTIAAGLTADSDTFTLNSGTLTGDGDLNVTGLLTWTYGTMSGTGSTIANGGITFSGNHARYLDGRTLENGGTAVFQDGNLQTYNGAVIYNLAGSTFDFQGDDVIYVSTGGATFQNEGTVTKSAGSGTLIIYPAFVNGGSVDVQAGAIQFGGDFTQTAAGTLYVQIGGLTPITDFDQFNISGDAVLNGTLDVTLTGGYVPDPGDSFEVMTFATRTGQFALVNGHGQGYTVNYNTADVTLVAQ